MILLILLLIVLLALLAIVVFAVAAGGVAMLIVFGDLIVCSVFIILIMRWIIKRNKRKNGRS